MKLSSYSHKGNSLSQPVKYKRVFPTARFSSPIVIWVLNRCFPSACLASLSTTTTSPPPPPPQPSCLASLRFYYFSLYLDASGSRAPAHATNITRSRVSTDPSERDETLTRIGQHGPTYCGTNVYHARVLARYKRNFPSTIAFYRFPFSPRISFFFPLQTIVSLPLSLLPSFSLFFSFFFSFSSFVSTSGREKNQGEEIEGRQEDRISVRTNAKITFHLAGHEEFIGTKVAGRAGRRFLEAN